MYLKIWTPYFDPKLDNPSAVLFWVSLLHLPLHCWGDDSLKDIGNKLGKYIDKTEPKKGMFQFARICVEVDLEKGLLEAIHLILDNWSHYQQLDCEQLPFNCK